MSSATPADKFLSLVEYRHTGPDRGLFRVPSRKDRNMSGTFRELPDGRLLIFDHGGDSPAEILDAIGLQLGDLFPEPMVARGHPERRPFPAADCLRAVAFEGTVIAAAGAALLAGEPFDRSRLILALERVNGALSAAGLGVLHAR